MQEFGIFVQDFRKFFCGSLFLRVCFENGLGTQNVFFKHTHKCSILSAFILRLGMSLKCMRVMSACIAAYSQQIKVFK